MFLFVAHGAQRGCEREVARVGGLVLVVERGESDLYLDFGDLG